MIYTNLTFYFSIIHNSLSNSSLIAIMRKSSKAGKGSPKLEQAPGDFAPHLPNSTWLYAALPFLMFWLGLPNAGFSLCSARSCGWCKSKSCEWNDGKDQTWGGSQTCKRTGHKGDPQCLHWVYCCLILCILLYVLIHDMQFFICSTCDLLNWLSHLQRFVSKVSGKPDEWNSFRKGVFGHGTWE